MSSQKTPNLNMHKWVATDPVQRAEFNENFDKIDQHVNTVNAQLADTKQYVNYQSLMDGTKTTSQAIQELVNKGTEKIYLPYGETVLTEPIIVKTGLEVIGFHNLNGKDSNTPMSTIVVNGFDAFVNPNGTRVRINLKDIKIKGTKKTEIGIGSLIGGYFENVWFTNLGKGFYSTEAWGSRFINCFFENNDIGVQVSQPYSVSFSYCAWGDNRIDLEQLDDAISMSLENCLINLTNTTEVSLILKGDVKLDTVYFEKFHEEIVDVVIDYSFDKFGNGAFSMNNCSCGGVTINHVIRLSMKDGQTGGILSGEIAYNNFYNLSSDAIIYGINNDFLPPYIHDNKGATVANKNPIKAYKPLTSSKIKPDVDISSTSYVTVPIDYSVIFDNVSAFSTVAGKYRVRKEGFYRVFVNLGVKSTASDYRSTGMRILVNGLETASTITSLKYISGTSYANLTLEVITTLLASAATIEIQANNGQLTQGGVFVCEYIGNGH